MVFRDGLSTSTGHTNGNFIGYKFGGGRGLFGGFTSASTSTVHQTALSKAASPPWTPPLGCAFILLLIGLVPIFFGGVSARLLRFLEWPLLAATLYLFPAVYYLSSVLPRRRTNWAAKALCLRCGVVFYPGDVPHPKAEESCTGRVLIALCVGVLVCVALHVWLRQPETRLMTSSPTSETSVPSPAPTIPPLSALPAAPTTVPTRAILQRIAQEGRASTVLGREPLVEEESWDLTSIGVGTEQPMAAQAPSMREVNQNSTGTLQITVVAPDFRGFFMVRVNDKEVYRTEVNTSREYGNDTVNSGPMPVPAGDLDVKIWLNSKYSIDEGEYLDEQIHISSQESKILPFRLDTAAPAGKRLVARVK